jgi:hypothetical protein
MLKLAAHTTLLAIFVFGNPALYSQDKPAVTEAAKVDLPSGESIMDKFIEASGGIKAYKKMKNKVI